jgi:hypothetical protein
MNPSTRPRATASFRFYGELNRFLAPTHRQRTVTLRCAEAATVKHMVEALGVPHTEVHHLFVNDLPAGLEQLLAEGDRVAVFPAWTALPAPHPSLQALPPGAPRFLADAHLGGLARTLRMAGFDTLYDNRWHDTEIEAVGAHEQRIVLTRDRELLKRRTILYGAFVHPLAPDAQFAEIARRFALAPLARPFTLCLHCNARLRPIAKSEVLEQLPPAVRATQDEFSTCGQCHRIYWKGSHWRRMAALLDSALAS